LFDTLEDLAQLCSVNVEDIVIHLNSIIDEPKTQKYGKDGGVMNKIVDARGLNCPQPVILTKKAMEEADSDKITTL